METTSNNRFGFLKIIYVIIMTMVPGILYAATYYADTDGDGYTDTITTSGTTISIYHPSTGNTATYPYVAENPSLQVINDTDGLPGSEIIIYWYRQDLTGNGIDVIHDRTGSTSRYVYEGAGTGKDENPSIEAVADTDGLPGKEIIIYWYRQDLTGAGFDVIHDATYTTNRYASLGTGISIQLVRDYDKIAGAEICYHSNSAPNGYGRIADRTRVTSTVATCTKTDPAQPPIVAIRPPSGSSNAGAAQNFKAVYYDANGYQNIKQVVMRLRQNSNSWANAISVKYVRATNSLYLLDDAGTTWLGPCTPGTANTISNSKGILNCAQTSVSTDEKDLTVKWNITPKTTFTGTKYIYLSAGDNAGLSSGLIVASTWTIY